MTTFNGKEYITRLNTYFFTLKKSTLRVNYEQTKAVARNFSFLQKYSFANIEIDVSMCISALENRIITNVKIIAIEYGMCLRMSTTKRTYCFFKREI